MALLLTFVFFFFFKPDGNDEVRHSWLLVFLGSVAYVHFLPFFQQLVVPNRDPQDPRPLHGPNDQSSI